MSGLEGIATIADDSLVYGRGVTLEEAKRDHDVKFRALLQHCRERGIPCNENKFKLHVTSIPYMGHLFTDTGLKSDPHKVEAINK